MTVPVCHRPGVILIGGPAPPSAATSSMAADRAEASPQGAPKKLAKELRLLDVYALATGATVGADDI